MQSFHIDPSAARQLLLPTLYLLGDLTFVALDDGERPLCSMQQLAEWCQTAGLALCRLATLCQPADTAQQASRSKGAGEEGPSFRAASALLTISLNIAFDVNNLLETMRLADSRGRPPAVTNPGAAAEAHSALWQLHSTACRLVHSGQPQRLPGLQPAVRQHQLLQLLDRLKGCNARLWEERVFEDTPEQ